jgi:hypothetical protein
MQWQNRVSGELLSMRIPPFSGMVAANLPGTKYPGSVHAIAGEFVDSNRIFQLRVEKIRLNFHRWRYDIM